MSCFDPLVGVSQRGKPPVGFTHEYLTDRGSASLLRCWLAAFIPRGYWVYERQMSNSLTLLRSVLKLLAHSNDFLKLIHLKQCFLFQFSFLFLLSSYSQYYHFLPRCVLLCLISVMSVYLSDDEFYLGRALLLPWQCSFPAFYLIN